MRVVRGAVAGAISVMLVGVTAPVTTTTAGAATPLPQSSINAQSREALQQGGELRLAVDALPSNWNPFVAGGSPAVDAILAPMAYTMWRFDAAGTPVLDTDYVLSVEVSGAEGGPATPPASDAPQTGAPAGVPCALPADPFTVTYGLNPAAHWNDGSPITVADFQANWAALNGTNPDFQVESAAGYDRIGAVEAGVDATQVVVRFCQPYADFEALFANLVPAAAVADPTTFNDGWTGAIRAEWLAGPFTVGTFDPTTTELELVANPAWWGAPPLLDAISFRVVPADRTPQAFANGELDSFAVGMDVNGYQLASTTAGAEVRAAIGRGFRQLTLNVSSGALADPAVRRALAMALDRQAIAAADLAGLPMPAAPLTHHLLPATSPLHQDNAGGLSTHDPAAAGAALDAAGWVAGGDGVRTRDGARLTVSFSRIGGVSASAIEAPLVQAQLAAAGFEVTITDLPADSWLDAVAGGGFQLVAFNWSGSPFPYRAAAQLYADGARRNYAFSTIPGVGDLLADLATTTDETERAAIAHEIDALLWEHGHSIPLYQLPDAIAVRTALANWGAFGLASPVWTDLGYLA